MGRKTKNIKPLIYVFCEGESEQVYTDFLKETFKNVAVIKRPNQIGVFEIADAMFKIMNGQEADIFLKYLCGNLSSNEFCKMPLVQKSSSRTLLNVLKEDTNTSDKDAEQNLEELFADLGDAVKSAEKLEDWKQRFWKISGNLKIFEHLDYQD